MSSKAYAASVKASFRGLYSANLSTLDFADAMYSAIRRGFESAFAEGQRDCGLLPDERSPEEQAKLNELIGDNNQYVGALATWLFDHSKANGFKFADVEYRAQLWINRYEEVKAIATMMTCKNRKYQWRLGTVKHEHCRSCLKLSGRVARAQTWADRGVTPRATNGTLKCGGYNCACGLHETDLPVTRGRWPNLP